MLVAIAVSKYRRAHQLPDAFQVVADPEIDIIVEMIGGDGIAKTLMLKAIENKTYCDRQQGIIGGSWPLDFQSSC